MDALYYESHVTVEPVYGSRLEWLKEIAAGYEFRVADLLMRKRLEDTPERSEFDTFCTGRDSDDVDALTYRTLELVDALQVAHFDVWRWKIEAAIEDQRLGKAA